MPRCARWFGLLTLNAMLMWMVPLAVGACSGLVSGDGASGDGDREPRSPGDNGGPTEAPEETAWQPAPTPVPLPPEAINAVAAAISTTLNAVPYTHSVRVDNLTTGQTVFASNADVMRKPASNMKLITTAAGLELLGKDHRQTVRAFGTAAPDSTGTINGDLHLIFEHFFIPTTRAMRFEGDVFEVYRQQNTSFQRIAALLYRSGLRRVTGNVVLGGALAYVRDETTYGPIDLAEQRQAAAGPLLAELTRYGIVAAGVTTSTNLVGPSGAVPITTFQSNGALLASSGIHVASNNEAADVWSHHLGWAIAGDSSYAGGERVMLDWVASTGTSTVGVAFKDGSGLSHSNRLSADVVVSLLAFMDKSPLGASWRRSLAISGRPRSTLSNRLLGPDTVGRVFAKTGTLRDTKAMSGYLDNKHDGQRYAFSGLLNSVTDTETAFDRLEDIVQTFAGNLRGSAARLPTPHMVSARGLGFVGVGKVEWLPVAGAVGYLLWFSADGYSWRRADARLVEGVEAIVHGLAPSEKAYVRATALDSDGLESDPSVVMVLSASDKPADLLLVDANTRWYSQPTASNTTVAHHDFLVGLADSVQLGVGSATVAAVVSGEVDLRDYSAVLWAAGEESSEQDVLAPTQQAVLGRYLDSGGSVVLSGAELLWTMRVRNDPADADFQANVIHAGYAADSAETHEFYGEPAGEFASIALASFRSPDAMSVTFPDVLTPMGGEVLLRYQGGVGGVAAVGHRDASGIITFGFPIEAMQSPGDREELLSATFRYLGVLP